MKRISDEMNQSVSESLYSPVSDSVTPNLVSDSDNISLKLTSVVPHSTRCISGVNLITTEFDEINDNNAKLFLC